MKKRLSAWIAVIVLLIALMLTGCREGKNNVPADNLDPNNAALTLAPTAEATTAPTPELTPEPTEPPFVYPSVEPLEIHTCSMHELVILLPDQLFSDQCNQDYTGAMWHNIFSVLQTAEYLNIIPALRETENYDYILFDVDEGFRFIVHIMDRPGDLRSLVGFPMLINEVHSYSDFVSLKVGDPIDAVARIDPAAEVIKREIWWSREGIKRAVKSHNAPTSIHYLTDGVLKIEYDMDDAGELFVLSITYSEDYTIESAVSPGTIVNYRVIPCDLPPAWGEAMAG